MLGHAVTLGLEVQGYIVAPGPVGHYGSSAQATGVCSIHNCMVLDECHSGYKCCWNSRQHPQVR